MTEEQKKEALKKDIKYMKLEELELLKEYETNILKNVENILMMPSATDESLEFARPLMESCKTEIAKIDELIQKEKQC